MPPSSSSSSGIPSRTKPSLVLPPAAAAAAANPPQGGNKDLSVAPSSSSQQIRGLHLVREEEEEEVKKEEEEDAKTKTPSAASYKPCSASLPRQLGRSPRDASPNNSSSNNSSNVAVVSPMPNSSSASPLKNSSKDSSKEEEAEEEEEESRRALKSLVPMAPIFTAQNNSSSAPAEEAAGRNVITVNAVKTGKEHMEKVAGKPLIGKKQREHEGKPPKTQTEDHSTKKHPQRPFTPIQTGLFFCLSLPTPPIPFRPKPIPSFPLVFLKCFHPDPLATANICGATVCVFSLRRKKAPKNLSFPPRKRLFLDLHCFFATAAAEGDGKSSG